MTSQGQHIRFLTTTPTMDEIISAFSQGAIVLTTLYFFNYLRKRVHDYRTRLPLPRGPPGWPIIGNVLDMPSEQEWFKFTEWRDTYGSLLCLDSSQYYIHPDISLSLSQVTSVPSRTLVKPPSSSPTLKSPTISWKKEVAYTRIDQSFK